MSVRALCAKPVDHENHTGTLPANFAGKFEQTESGCWVWVKAIQTRGYGSVCIGQGKTALAHRAAWESWFGPVPDGLTIDHLCRNKRCIHPCHMEPVTGAVNSRRATAYYLAGNAMYPCGHPRTPENTKVRTRKNGWINRCCKACFLNATRLYKQRQRESKRRQEPEAA